MNKLFCIVFKHNEEACGYKNFWNESEAIEYMKSMRDYWTFVLVEDNDIHKIWEGV